MYFISCSDNLLHRTVRINLPPTPTHRPVQNICSFLLQARQSNQSPKLLVSSSKGLCGYHDLSSTIDPTRWFRYVTLDQVLIEFGINQRMLLSFTLASSLLQLHATPWLASLWGRQNICFRQVKAPSGIHFPDADHPFVRHTFSPTLGPTNSSYSVRRQLLELGIMLLEIWHREALEACTLSKGMALGNTDGGRYDAAKNWLDQTEQDILPFYLDVVRRCIECTFATSLTTYSWDDEDFRSSSCEHVVKPLWDNCTLSRAR